MAYDPEKHHRRSIRIKHHDYSSPGWYFITICTKDRECLFGDVVHDKMELSQIGTMVEQCWLKIPDHFSTVGIVPFVIMPNHLHGIIEIQRKNLPHSKGQKDCRGLIHQTLEKNRPQHDHQSNELSGYSDWILMRTPGVTLGKIVRFFKASATRKIRDDTTVYFSWQKNYYEQIIRNQREFFQKKRYIRDNPENWDDDEHNPKNL